MTRAAKTGGDSSMIEIELDSRALKQLTNRDKQTFESWTRRHETERRRYSEEILEGYPPPHEAASKVQHWETKVAYCREQLAVARAFHKRALAVCRVILGKRGVKATEAGADARTWEQYEEVERWEALVTTYQDWIYEARAYLKSLIPEKF